MKEIISKKSHSSPLYGTKINDIYTNVIEIENQNDIDKEIQDYEREKKTLKKYPFVYIDKTPINTIEELVIDYYAINFLSLYKENKLQINDSFDIQVESGLIDINIYDNNPSRYYFYEENNEKWQLSRNIDSLIKIIYKIEYNKFLNIINQDGRHDLQVLNSKVLKLNNLLFTKQKSNSTIVVNEIVNDSAFISLNPDFSFNPNEYQDIFEIMLLVIHRVFLNSYCLGIWSSGLKIDFEIYNKLCQIDHNDFIYLHPPKSQGK